jgi:hypothetical protein
LKEKKKRALYWNWCFLRSLQRSCCRRSEAKGHYCPLLEILKRRRYSLFLLQWWSTKIPPLLSSVTEIESFSSLSLIPSPMLLSHLHLPPPFIMPAARLYHLEFFYFRVLFASIFKHLIHLYYVTAWFNSLVSWVSLT